MGLKITLDVSSLTSLFINTPFTQPALASPAVYHIRFSSALFIRRTPAACFPYSADPRPCGSFHTGRVASLRHRPAFSYDAQSIHAPSHAPFDFYSIRRPYTPHLSGGTLSAQPICTTEAPYNIPLTASCTPSIHGFSAYSPATHVTAASFDNAF